MLLWGLLLSLIFLATTWASCPFDEKLYPCTCDWLQGQQSIGVTCSRLDTYDKFNTAFEALRGRRAVQSLTIEDSVLLFIPADTFRGTQFKEVDIRRSTLQALTDTDAAFPGLEDSLESLRLSESTLMSNWDWTIFGNLKNLKEVMVLQGTLKYIDDSLEQVNSGTMSDINFSSNMIVYLSDKAFASFKNLKSLQLTGNEIKVVKRSMIPDPAPELGSLDIGSNKLEKLPADFFTNMPKLKILGLAHNRILFMDQTVFKPIWHLLERFSIMDNDLRCDCRMSWILEQKFPGYVAGRCSNPQNVRGKYINGLLPKDLFCFIKK